VNDLRLRFKLESKGSKKTDLMQGLDEIRMAEDEDSSSSSSMM